MHGLADHVVYHALTMINETTGEDGDAVVGATPAGWDAHSDGRALGGVCFVFVIFVMFCSGSGSPRLTYLFAAAVVVGTFVAEWIGFDATFGRIGLLHHSHRGRCSIRLQRLLPLFTFYPCSC